jgi:5-hydroxyisourate hydrolase
MTGRLTTHVLDTARGVPGAGIAVTLFAIDGAARHERARAVTNANGRTDAPLLEGPALVAGRYELVFETAAYFRAAGVVLADPPFLDDIVLRFAIADAASHYHVPLLVSPWSYATYRGS